MSTLPNNIQPAATSVVFQNDPGTVQPDKPEEGGEQFDHLMMRALMNPSRDGSKISGQSFQNHKIEAERSPASSTGMTAAAGTSATRTSGSPASNASTAAKANFLAGNPDGPFGASVNTAWLPPTANKNQVTGQNLKPGNTGSDFAPHASKDIRPATPASGPGNGSTTGSNPEGARNPSASAGSNNAAVNPWDAVAQIPIPMTTLDGLNTKGLLDAAAGGKTSDALLMSSAANGLEAMPTKASNSVSAQNQPKSEANPKTQTDSTKRESTFNGIEAYNANSAGDSKTAALAKATGQIPVIANEEVDGDSKLSIPAAKPTQDTPAPGLAALSGTDPNTLAPAQSSIDGTPTAQQDELMNNGDKSTKTADLTGKFLPGSVAVVSRGNDMPVRADQFMVTTAASGSMQTNPGAATESTTVSAESIAADDLRSQALERMHDLVAVHALRLGDIGNGSSLQVVIKPGAGTQMSLELRQHGGGIEAQAALQQGNFKHLSQHWPELQQRLEQRGIRLAPLTDEGAFNRNSGSGTSKEKQQPSGEGTTGLAFATPETATFTPRSARVKVPAGWETWA